MPIRISVVIPCYNGEPYLAQALDSVLAQRLPAAEIVLVDDGSTDATPEIGRRYAAQHPLVVRYIRQEKSGVATARNNAVNAAQSEWIAFLDADDWWKPAKLERQAAVVAGSPGCDLVYTPLELHYPDGTIENARSTPPEAIWPNLRYGNLITPSSVMMRRDMFIEGGGFNPRIHGSEDWELFARLIIRQKMRVGWVPETLTCYRETNTNSSKRIDGMLEADLLSLPTMISDLDGFRAYLWGRRILAAIMFRAAMNARGAGDPRELGFLARSISYWPLLLPGRARYAAFVLALFKQMTR